MSQGRSDRFVIARSEATRQSRAVAHRAVDCRAASPLAMTRRNACWHIYLDILNLFGYVRTHPASQNRIWNREAARPACLPLQSRVLLLTTGDVTPASRPALMRLGQALAGPAAGSDQARRQPRRKRGSCAPARASQPLRTGPSPRAPRNRRMGHSQANLPHCPRRIAGRAVPLGFLMALCPGSPPDDGVCFSPSSFPRKREPRPRVAAGFPPAWE